MKRIICLLVAAAMLLSTALADGFSFSMADYLGCTNSLLPRLGYAVEWSDNSENVGFISAKGEYQGMKGNHALYAHGDPILALEIVYCFGADAVVDSDEAVDAYLTEFAAILSSAALCSWIADHANDENISEALAAVNEAMPAEMDALMKPVTELTEDYTGEQLRQEGTCCGYPAVFSMGYDSATGQWLLRVLITMDAELIAIF